MFGAGGFRCGFFGVRILSVCVFRSPTSFLHRLFLIGYLFVIVYLFSPLTTHYMLGIFLPLRIAPCSLFRGHVGAGAWVCLILVDVARPGAEAGVHVCGWWCTCVARRYFLVVRFS